MKSNKINNDKELRTNLANANTPLETREDMVFKTIKQGNVPHFLMKLVKISHTEKIDGKDYTIEFYVTPDYFSIGNNLDYIYMPMTPILAQKVGNKLYCSLPTKKMVDLIYTNATIKLAPLPIPPSASMTTFSVFKQHDELIKEQLKALETRHLSSELTAGNKKDIIISNKIYGEPTNRVVIYGWHQIDGKPIQPVYNKHTNTWADYSHGIRLVQNKVWVNGKKTTIAQVLADKKLCVLLSDEGRIEKSFYPITEYKL
ncbi:MAG: hypothetical protein EOO93_07280 [Pedobacter sp.]|nr:MAG: hypothetical protein EOO93_07280 [Pedobacter sp.]